GSQGKSGGESSPARPLWATTAGTALGNLRAQQSQLALQRQHVVLAALDGFLQLLDALLVARVVAGLVPAALRFAVVELAAHAGEFLLLGAQLVLEDPTAIVVARLLRVDVDAREARRRGARVRAGFGRRAAGGAGGQPRRRDRRR